MDKTDNTCPVCEEGTITPQMDFLFINGAFIPSHFHLCDTCGCEIGTKEDSKRNKEIMQEFRSNND